MIEDVDGLGRSLSDSFWKSGDEPFLKPRNAHCLLVFQEECNTNANNTVALSVRSERLEECFELAAKRVIAHSMMCPWCALSET